MKNAIKPTSIGSRNNWTYLLLFCIVLAGALRFYHLGQASLTHDEAWRANFAAQGKWDDLRRMPPLQCLVMYAVQRVVPHSEFALRFPYALAGVLCVAALYLFARKHLGESSAVLIALAAAVHPMLVIYSRCIKVFSFEALMSVLLMWMGYQACIRCTRRNLNLFLITAVIGLGLTFTASLIIAAWTPILIWSACRNPNKQGASGTHPTEPTMLAATLYRLAFIALVGALWFWWLAGSSHRQGVINYHGQELGAWPEGLSPAILGPWLVRACYGAVQYVLGISQIWSPLNWIIGTVEILAICASVGVLWKRLRRWCVFSVVLWIIAMAAGALSLWPFGALHTATFLVPGVLLALGCGLDQLCRRLGRSWATLMIVAVSLVIPGLRAVKATMIHPTYREHVRPLLEYVATHREDGDALFVYYALDDALKFYGPPDATMPILIQPRSDRTHLDTFTHRFDAFIADHNRVWFILGHNWGNEQDEYLRHFTTHYHVSQHVQSGNSFACLVKGIANDE